MKEKNMTTRIIVIYLFIFNFYLEARVIPSYFYDLCNNVEIIIIARIEKVNDVKNNKKVARSIILRKIKGSALNTCLFYLDSFDNFDTSSSKKNEEKIIFLSNPDRDGIYTIFAGDRGVMRIIECDSNKYALFHRNIKYPVSILRMLKNDTLIFRNQIEQRKLIPLEPLVKVIEKNINDTLNKPQLKLLIHPTNSENEEFFKSGYSLDQHDSIFIFEGRFNQSINIETLKFMFGISPRISRLNEKQVVWHYRLSQLFKLPQKLYFVVEGSRVKEIYFGKIK